MCFFVLFVLGESGDHNQQTVQNNLHDGTEEREEVEQVEIRKKPLFKTGFK